jgi:hypothetical protein
MKILLDECVPWPLHRLLADHDCVTAQHRGWGGVRNGQLLRSAEGEFALFLTSDQSLQYQQNLTGYRIAILQLSTNKWRRIRAAALLIQAAVATMKPGGTSKVGDPVTKSKW